jgi:hypothetical protein
LAAVASNSNANNLISAQSNNNNNSESMQGNLKTRSLADNIEMLNSKFLSHKNFSEKFAEKNPDSSSLNTLLATVNSQNYSQNVNTIKLKTKRALLK